MTTTTKVRARTRHPELAKPEYARVYWHHGRYHYRSRKGLPMIALGTDLGSALFRAKLAIAKQADRAWHAYIERKLREMLKGSPRRQGSPKPGALSS